MNMTNAEKHFGGRMDLRQDAIYHWSYRLWVLPSVSYHMNRLYYICGTDIIVNGAIYEWSYDLSMQ
jgi:hypothetical protein